jgi:glycosyltransferase involved in cell wall biosynthesis
LSVTADILTQAEGKPVEVLYLLDNQKMTVGRKRNILLSIAQGEFFAFVDDDDSVAPDYLERLLTAIDLAGNVGVICFPQRCDHADTGEVEHCTYGLEYVYAKNGDQWTGKPAHTQCWRTDLVQDVEFPEGNFGEDVGWVAKACQRVMVEYRIPDCPELYFYRFDPERSKTRGR